MSRVNLTPFGFTPTESLIYEVLLTGGPGTGYAIARTAGLARANAYSALEGLVAKGAARVDPGRPKRYRPEAPAALIARISTDHGLALERLTGDLDAVTVPASPTLVEVESGRAVLQLITHDVARAMASVALVLPGDAFPLLAPALRRPFSAGIPLSLASTTPVDLGFVPIEVIAGTEGWPGMPILAVVDDRSAVIAARNGPEVRGHWSTAPAFVAGARLAMERLRERA
jgi:sugar-specific transcriptional regulator TrmB